MIPSDHNLLNYRMYNAHKDLIFWIVACVGEICSWSQDRLNQGNTQTTYDCQKLNSKKNKNGTYGENGRNDLNKIDEQSIECEKNCSTTISHMVSHCITQCGSKWLD